MDMTYQQKIIKLIQGQSPLLMSQIQTSIISSTIVQHEIIKSILHNNKSTDVTSLIFFNISAKNHKLIKSISHQKSPFMSHLQFFLTLQLKINSSLKKSPLRLFPVIKIRPLMLVQWWRHSVDGQLRTYVKM